MFRPIHLIPEKTDLNFVKFRFISLIVSTMLILISLISFLFVGLNYGIDFKGGVLFEIRTNSGSADIPNLRKNLNNLNLGDISIQSFGKETDVLIRIQKQEGDDKIQSQKLSIVKELLSEDHKIRRTEFVGPTVGKELKKNGFWAVILALSAILFYIWFRFEWQFAIAAIIALFHDVLTTIGLFVLTGFEFNISTVAAILTIAGYSINDTVVVFDRVRENLRKSKSLDKLKIINTSLNETLSRTITTSVTTLIALFTIYIFGGEVLSIFTLAMIWGVLIGTYSSIFVASALLTFFQLRRGDEEEDQSIQFNNG